MRDIYCLNLNSDAVMDIGIYKKGIVLNLDRGYDRCCVSMTSKEAIIIAQQLTQYADKLKEDDNE